MLTVDQIYPLLAQTFDKSDLPLPDKQSGKVREWYPLAADQRLLITTDRLSAFDRILACVPYKGQVLNQLSAWWFDQTNDIIPNHKISLPDPNALVAKEAKPLAVEVVVRGYITGVTSTALWYRYSIGERDIYGYHFPEGLHKNESLPVPIITPTTKGGATGHDERLTCAEVIEHGLLKPAIWDQVQSASLALFKYGQEIAQRAGLILVDTKYEFGLAPDGSVMLIDEVHTPDSSRFWRAETYEKRIAANEEPENLDKEFVRLAYAQKGYRGDGPLPEMPDVLWVMTSQLYITMYELLTRETFRPAGYPLAPRLHENLRKAGLLK